MPDNAQQFEPLKQLLAIVMQNKQLMALVSAEWQKMKQSQGIGHPDAYSLPASIYGDPDAADAATAQLVAQRVKLQKNLGGLPDEGQLPMPSQKGTAPKTPNPLSPDELESFMEENGYDATDSGIRDAVNDILEQQLFAKKLPGHLYDNEPPGSDKPSYALPPGRPPIGPEKGWYPGSGPVEIDRPLDQLRSRDGVPGS